MLETTPKETTKSFALIAFEPRQVALAKQREMKIKKIQSETLENETSDQMVTLKSNHKEKTKKKKKTSSRDSSPLLLSIAAYLEHNGFVKTLTAFRSEALIDELDGSNEHSLDLEMYYKYLEASKYGAEANLNGSLELDLQKDSTIKKIMEESKCDASVKSISKKKRTKDKESDADTVTEQHIVSNGFSKCATDSDEKLTDEVVPTLVVKSKEKKKKNKVVSNSLDESAKKYGSETFKVPAENTVRELQLDESDKKPKDKKKKKSKLISAESVVQGDPEALPQAIKEKTIDLESSQSAVSIERKGSKKRKSLASEENESQTDGKIESEEAKRQDIEGSVEGKGKDHLLKANPLQESDGHASKKRKTENGQVDSNKKHRNGSAEPKTVNAFQRVKIDEVEFVDERLQDNSYWAKDGADIGYGAKAQEVLGQVRGRDFRHEKTKKKRGSYRGGQIDLQSHSIKFDNSDDE